MLPSRLSRRPLEAQDGSAMGDVSTLQRLQAAFEQAGVRFMEANESGGIGLRLPKPPARGNGELIWVRLAISHLFAATHSRPTEASQVCASTPQQDGDQLG
jgi:hypothetical protein